MIISTLWLAIFGEAYIRIFREQPMLPRYVMAGDFGIRVNMPNMTYTHTSADYKVTIQTNDKGMRNDESITYANPNNHFRILILGDSFAMGYGVNFDETFTFKLQQLVEAKINRKVEIINLAVSGYSSAEQLLMYKNEGRKFSPDIVVSTWHSSDLNENLRSNLFKLTAQGLSRNNSTYLPGIKQREILYSIPGFQFVAQHSQLYNFAREKAARFIKKVLLSKNQTQKQAHIQTQNAPSPSLKAVNLSLAILKSLQKDIATDKSKFVMLNIPNKLSRGHYEDTIPPKIREKFSANIVDITSDITEASKDQLIYWERAQGHFTPTGTSIVAHKLFNFLEKKNLITSQKSKPQHDYEGTSTEKRAVQ